MGAGRRAGKGGGLGQMLAKAANRVHAVSANGRGWEGSPG